MEDVAALNANFFYGWSEACGTRPNCLNMVRSMQLPRECYSVLLVGNEPNWIEPSGAPVSPEDAAEKVRAIEKMCPKTKLVVGGVIPADTTAWGGCCSGRDWLLRFLAVYPDFSQALAVHCYDAYDSNYCIQQLAELRGLYAGEMWVTEFNCVRECTGEYFLRLLDAAAQYDACAIYTNRQPDAPWALPGASLVNGDGTLTTFGVLYRDYPVSRRRSCVPWCR